MADQRRKTPVHGFTQFVDFVKALTAVGVTIVAIGGFAYAQVQADLDKRYAPISLVEEVKRIGDISLQAQRTILLQQLEQVQRRLCDPAVQGEFRQSESRRKGQLRGDYRNLFDEYPYTPDCSEIYR